MNSRHYSPMKKAGIARVDSNLKRKDNHINQAEVW